MQAGKLKEIITVRKPIIVKDEYGSTQTEWVEVFTTRANVIHQSGNKQVENYEVFHTYTKIFEIRLFHFVDEKMRISYNGKNYNILSIEPNKELQKIIIITELLNE